MKIIRICLSAIMLLVGATVLTFLVVNAQGRENFVGNFLFLSYSFMGYTVPLFFFWLFYIITRKDVALRSVMWPLLALLPFFFFSLSLRTLLWSNGMSLPPVWAITQLFGQSGAGVFWIVLGTSTILLVSMLYYNSNTKELMKKNSSQTMESIKNMSNQRSVQFNGMTSPSPYARYQKNPIFTQNVIPQHDVSAMPPQPIYQPIDQVHHTNNSIQDTTSTTENISVRDTNAELNKKEPLVETDPSNDNNTQQDSKKDDMHLKYASYPTGLETEKNEDMFPSRNDSRYILFFHRDNSVRKQLYYTEYEHELLQDRTPIGAEGFTNIPSAVSVTKEKETVHNTIASEVDNNQVSKNEIDSTDKTSNSYSKTSANIPSHAAALVTSQAPPQVPVVDMSSSSHHAIQNEITQTPAKEEMGTVIAAQNSQEDEVVNDEEIDIFDIHAVDNSMDRGSENHKNAFLQLDENDEIMTIQDRFAISEIEEEFDTADFNDNVFDDDFNEVPSSANFSHADQAVQTVVLEKDHEKQNVYSNLAEQSKKNIHKDLDSIVNKKLSISQEDSEISKEKDQSTSHLKENSKTPTTQEIMRDSSVPHEQDSGVANSDIKKTKIPTAVSFSKKIEAILKKETVDTSSDDSIDMKKKTNELPVVSKVRKRKGRYFIPISGVLNPPLHMSHLDDTILKEISQRLEVTLQEFNIQAKVISICRGAVVTLFEILPASGVRVRRIVELSDNIALRLAAPSIRIVAPIPGKEAVGIEVPNKTPDIVRFSELISQSEFHNKKHVLPIALGKSILAKTVVVDLAKTPHMLIAGATGSGKSVCINSIICSLLYSCDPDSVKLILIDPKIVELSFYNDIPHLLTPVISDPVKSVKVLYWCVEEMERRYAMLEQYNVREIESYNKKIYTQNSNIQKMSYIVIVIDEFADLMMTSGKEMEILVSRITAKSRAVGIHLVIATQRPSTDVITGLIKSNVPTRISFMVASKIDSRIILDVNGAEKLLGKGDMLYSSAQHPLPDRLQGAYLEEEEVERVVEYVKRIGGSPQYMDESLFEQNKQENDGLGGLDDPLWDQAVEEIIQSKRASASHLQRRFKIGYNRAARLIDDMEYNGIIGPQQGGRQREILVA